MSALQSIEHQILALPKTDAAQLQDWLSEYLEDEADLSPDFVASIERGKAEVAAGQFRVAQP